MQQIDDDAIKCVRCSTQMGFGEAAYPPSMTRAEVIASIVEKLGWRKTFAGWQCPDHRR
jgi:hypothetical protein